MDHIGKRIKELRLKNALTQEKLGDLIGVSYKTVSKWECELTYPDISLVVPLSKVLGVTCDELLGAREKDLRLSELEKLYEEQGKINYPYSCIETSETAVREFPGNMKWLTRYAADKWAIALETLPDGDEFEKEREEVIKLLDRVIGNTEDIDLKYQAVCYIMGPLCGKGAKDEARKYLELIPEPKPKFFDKDRLLFKCLDGETQTEHKQKFVMKQFCELVMTLLWDGVGSNEDTCFAAEGIIKSMIPDGNYREEHHSMCHIYFRKAEIEMTRFNFNLAVDYINKAVYHANEYDNIASVNRGAYKYTAPLFDRVSTYSREWWTSEESLLDEVKNMLKDSLFDPLREREDCKNCLSVF